MWQITNEKVTIYKIAEGNYRANITRNDKDPETGEYGNPKYNRYKKVVVQFPFGVELKNKTIIKVTDGSLSTFDTFEKDEEGNDKLKDRVIKIKIKAFEVLQDGEEGYFTYNSKNTVKNDSRANKDDDIYSSTDVLPF